MKLFLSLSLFFSFSAQAIEKKIRYPIVSVVDGAVVSIDKHNQHSPTKKLESPNERVIYIVPEKAFLRVELTPKSEIIVKGPSKVEIPVIAWEDGAAERVILHGGELRYRCESQCEKVIETPLSRDSLTLGDYVYQYQPEIPYTQLTVIEGNFVFRGLENEEGVEVKTGQTVGFKGELEGGQPVYDVLLKGRKVARGKLSNVKLVPMDEMKKLKEMPILKKPELTIKKKKIKKLPDQICEEPLGKLNQCAWHFEKSKGPKICVRKRCNANGQWAERTEVETSHCSAKGPKVTACDY